MKFNPAPMRRAGEIAFGLLLILSFHLNWSGLAILSLALTGAIYGTWRTRGTLQNAFLSVSAFALGLWLLEIAGSYFEPRIEMIDDPGLFSARPIIGTGPSHAGSFRSRRTIDGKTIFDTKYTINERLLRDTISGQEGLAVTFLGDSFIFGDGIGNAGTLPQQLADLHGRRFPVFNLGFSGYSPAQVLALMETGAADDLFKRSGVLVQFVAPWQAERIACRSAFVRGAPRYETADQPTYVGQCEPRRSYFARFAAYRAFVAPRLQLVRPEDVDALIAVVNRTIITAQDKYRLPMVIYYLPDPAYLLATGYTDQDLTGEFVMAGARVLDYSFARQAEAPRYRIAGDSHPTGAANRIRAQRLSAYLSQEGLVGER